ncbi:hypothetical protein Lal_00043756 [Lupinus albus]|nr:hypothetical protein Lal_00043756 [Lupinus albus]
MEEEAKPNLEEEEDGKRKPKRTPKREKTKIISKGEIEERKQQGYDDYEANVECLRHTKSVVLRYLHYKDSCQLRRTLDGETKVALNLRESNIDIEVVHKMGFTLDPVTHRTYWHRTNRPTAPTEQPEATILDQPEVQAPCSSSATMASNHIIMDELVSLRGYITTRVDAIDTQNQQIHYELHHLSSRLNSMDIDEDSSELEP